MPITYANEETNEQMLSGISELPDGTKICVVDKGIYEDGTGEFVSDPGYPEFRYQETDEPLLDDFLESPYDYRFSIKEVIMHNVEWL